MDPPRPTPPEKRLPGGEGGDKANRGRLLRGGVCGGTSSDGALGGAEVLLLGVDCRVGVPKRVGVRKLSVFWLLGGGVEITASSLSFDSDWVGVDAPASRSLSLI